MKKILIFSIVLFCIVFIGCKQKSDIEFAKDFFEKLADGKTSVMDDIDWENFSGTGFDIGGKLKSISDNSEKKNLKKSFVSSFSDFFKKSGFRFNDISNWTIEDTNQLRTIISGEIKSGIYLYIVILKKADGRKISTVSVSNIDLNLPSEFCSTKKYEYSASTNLAFIHFPQSLIDKYIMSKEKEKAEKIKNRNYTEKIGNTSSYYTNQYLKNIYDKPSKTIEYFDTNGYIYKTVIYEAGAKIKEELKGNNKEIPNYKKYTVKTIDDNSGIIMEIYDNKNEYEYIKLDSIHYKLLKINRGNTKIFKYDKIGNLLNIFETKEAGDYNGMVSFFYDTSGCIINRLAYQISGVKEDSIYSVKRDSLGRIIEDVRFYPPGTYDINFYIIFKCLYRFDKTGSITERNLTSMHEFPGKLILNYNSGKNLSKVRYLGWPGPLFSEDFGDLTYIYDKNGLLIEEIYTGGDIFISTITTKYIYKLN